MLRENGLRNLVGVLWSYHTTPQSATKETPFRLTYGMETMIQGEFGPRSLRREMHEEVQQEDEARVELDLIKKIKEQA